MAETEERSLDNFFAKRDKKKKKERSNRAASAAGTAGGASGSSGAAGAAGGAVGAGARQGDGGTAAAGAAGSGAATKAVTKVRGRDSGPGPRAGAHVPAPARQSVREGPPAAGQRADGRGAGHVTQASRVQPTGRLDLSRGTPPPRS